MGRAAFCMPARPGVMILACRSFSLYSARFAVFPALPGYLFFGKGQSVLAATARPVVACEKLSPRHRAGLAASGRLPERAPCAETMAVGLRAGEKGKSVRFEPYAKSRPLQGPRRP
ncbi:MAG: hypothetical protein DBY17_00505 [Oscillospiraceae bacterium]|nr:MAG: hypothetical protein DBY17_00505 [Oscillospiraceae bacterium]